MDAAESEFRKSFLEALRTAIDWPADEVWRVARDCGTEHMEALKAQSDNTRALEGQYKALARLGAAMNEGHNLKAWLARVEDWIGNGPPGSKPPIPGPADDELAAVENAATRPATEFASAVMERLRRREGDVLFKTSPTFEGLEVGPGLLLACTAPPGFGKTTLVNQLAFEILQEGDVDRIVMANAETVYDKLYRAELSRRSGVPDKALRFADLNDGQMELVEQAHREAKPLLRKIDILKPPYKVEQLDKLVDDPRKGLLIVDYLQKFSSGDDARIGANVVTSALRSLALEGWAIIALSSAPRQQQKGGSGYDSNKMSIASFKESGEIEFNADSCYLLRDVGELSPNYPKVRRVLLDCVKNRHGEQKPLDLIFDMPRRQFRRYEEPALTDDDVFEDDADNPFADFESCGSAGTPF